MMPAFRVIFVGMLVSLTNVSGVAEREPPIQGCPAEEPLLSDKAGAPLVLSGRSLASRVTACVSPRLPVLARQARLEGQVHVGILQVHVGILVNRTGRVACVHLINGHPLLVGSAIEAARQWTFRPATQKRRAVSFYGILAFHYSTSGTTTKSGPCLDAHW